MKTLRIAEIDLPLPDGWDLSSDNRTYAGGSGLLDPRIEQLAEIDRDMLFQVKLKQSKVADGDVLAGLVRIQGRQCISTSYRRMGAIVLTYVIQLDDNWQLNAVYGIQPGFDDLAEQIREKIVNPQA